MTNIKIKIKTQLLDGASTAQEIADDINATSADVQAVLIEMDDAGDVLMRNGWYRLSERVRRAMR
jgi:predicted transcriptional regulator